MSIFDKSKLPQTINIMEKSAVKKERGMDEQTEALPRGAAWQVR